jgi:L-iditol 2-dehydrogenase
MNGADKVFVSEKLDYRGHMATNHGAQLVLNPDKEDVVAAIGKKEPLLLDVAIDCCGSQEAVDQALRCLKPGGRLVIVGIPEFDNWSISAEIIRRREITIINIRRQNHCEQLAIDALSSGLINLDDMITHRYPLIDAPKAYDLVADYNDGVMKAVLFC